jgi:hypothetical protein
MRRSARTRGMQHLIAAANYNRVGRKELREMAAFIRRKHESALRYQRGVQLTNEDSEALVAVLECLAARGARQ